MDESPVIRCGERSAAKDFGRANGDEIRAQARGRISHNFAAVAAAAVTESETINVRQKIKKKHWREKRKGTGRV